MIITAVALKALAAQALIVGAAAGLTVYVASAFYEKHRHFKEVMNENYDFNVVYANEEFNTSFREADIVEKIKTFDAFLKEEIITEAEYKKLKTALIESINKD